MLLRSILNGGEPIEILTYIVFSLVAVLITVTVHEFAHAFTAYKCGDSTAKNMGMMTLNPIKHANMINIVILLLFGFGWVSPLCMNVRNFKKPKVGIALTAASGAVMNLLVGFLFMVFSAGLEFVLLLKGENHVVLNIYELFQTIAIYNISYAVFNLIPFPPLDGAIVVSCFLKPRNQIKYLSLEKYFMFFLIGLIVVSYTFDILSIITSLIYFGFRTIIFNLIGLFL